MKSLSSMFLMGLLVSGFVLVCNLNFGAAQDSTEVGGIIHSDTTWTIENSPYSVTSTVQIPQNVTLKIDPGVTVTDNSPDYIMFLVHGKIEAHGTPTNKITFIGRGDWVVFFNTGGAVSGPSLSLDYCIIKHGMSVLQSSCGYINLTNSELINLGRIGGASSYILNSESDIYIENNMFIDTNGFYIADTDEHVYIRYNLFKGNRGFLVKEYVNTGFSPKAVVKYNTFINMSETVLLITSWNAQGNMDATENYWGTTNTNLIESWIEDGHTNIDIHAFIDYMPILPEPHPNTPTLPITASFDYSPTVVYAYGEVNFDANSSFAEYSQIANYTWDFGDGNVTTTTSSTINHTYVTPSSYSVNLTVTDEFGYTNSTSATIEVLQDEIKPTADAGQDKTVKVDTTVTFNASASSDNVGIVSYVWDFGDGTTGSGETSTHTYTHEGTYTVTLTVKDATGNADTHQITVTVQSDVLLLLLIIGVAAAIAVAAVAVFWKKRKKHS